MLQKTTLDFLKKLKKNNNKAWMDENKGIYLAAKADYESFCQGIINQIITFDPTIDGLLAKNCLFRINRDVRFSNNKDPYKSNFGCSIKMGGKKSQYCGYYLHVEPGACFVAAGFYGPEADILKKIRQEVEYNQPQFEKIVKNANFNKAFSGGLLQEGALVNVPKGYEKGHPAAAYLRLKHFVVTGPLKDEVLLDKNGIKELAKIFKQATPFIQFVNAGLTD